MRASCFLWTACVFLQSSRAIFTDDAFRIDYHHALVGIPQSHATFFHKPQSSSNASLLYTLSDKALLAAINPKDGSNLWRQSLSAIEVDNATNGFLVAGNKDGQVTSGYGNAISCWDALDGRLRWQYTIPEENVVLGLQAVQGPASETTGSAQDVVAVTGPSSGAGTISVVKLSGTSGEKVWEHTDANIGTGAALSLAASSKAVFLVAKSHGLLAGSKTKVLELNIATGKEISSHSPSLDPDVIAVASCPTHPFIVTSEQPYKNVKANVLGSSKVLTLSIDDKGEEIAGISVVYGCGSSHSPHFLVHVKSKTREWADVFHVSAKGDEVSKAYSLPATGEHSTFAAQAVGSDIYFTRTTDSEITLYSSASHARLGRWPVKTSGSVAISAPGLHAAAEVVSGKSGFAVRVAETSTTGHFSLLRNGEPQWSRPEVLAYASLASWIDDFSQNVLVDELEVEATGTPLTAYLHRLKRHFNDLAGLPHYLQTLPSNILGNPVEPVTDTQNQLIGNKKIVVATSRKDLIALDAGNAGLITWQTSVAETVLESAAITHIITADGRTTAYLSDGSFVVVNATTGQQIEYLQATVSASRMAIISASPAAAVVKIDTDGKPQIASDFAVPSVTEGNVIVTLSEAGTAFGWTIGREPRRTWTLRPKTGTKFTSAISRAENDPVASVGKVLGDRAVLYKYISPNLALLTATSPSSATIYLVDAVTGSVLHTSTHDGILVGSPVPAVMSENWFAFAYTSRDADTSALVTQLIISEIYESEAANDRGYLASKLNYSSFSPDAGSKPYVISQAFTVAQPISHLAVTQTGQGITTRQLLATLPETNAIVAIPRELLNARRPVDRDPTRDEQEEGLMKYSPSLDLDPKWYLTHAREVIGIKKMLTSPSLLESTSLVFAFGHDVFGTQVNPSGAFDVLGKGFNKIQLILTVVALFIGVLVVRPMVRSKMVDGRWTA